MRRHAQPGLLQIWPACVLKLVASSRRAHCKKLFFTFRSGFDSGTGVGGKGLFDRSAKVGISGDFGNVSSATIPNNNKNQLGVLAGMVHYF